jgi:hypothetical protein
MADAFFLQASMFYPFYLILFNYHHFTVCLNMFTYYIVLYCHVQQMLLIVGVMLLVTNSASK